MRTRILSTLILVPLVALFLYWGGWPFALLISIVAALALNELYALLREQGDRPLRIISSAASMLLLLHGMGLSDLLLPAAIALVVFGGLLSELASQADNPHLRGWATTVAGVFYIGWPLSLVVAVRNFENPDGLYWAIATAAGVWGCDTGAYLTGRFLGGRLFGPRQFSARWSPNKTWEGVVGGLLVAAIAVTALGVTTLGLVWWEGLLLGVLLGVAAISGDLAESMVKRRVGVKDSGDLIPGHGGMLDRIDSMLFAVVITYFFAHIFVY